MRASHRELTQPLARRTSKRMRSLNHPNQRWCRLQALPRVPLQSEIRCVSGLAQVRTPVLGGKAQSISGLRVAVVGRSPHQQAYRSSASEVSFVTFRAQAHNPLAGGQALAAYESGPTLSYRAPRHWHQSHPSEEQRCLPPRGRANVPPGGRMRRTPFDATLKSIATCTREGCRQTHGRWVSSLG